MGLDSVEMILEVEDHYGITIRNSEATHVRTFGDLVELVRSRIAAARSRKCPTLPAFLEVRRVIRVFLNQPLLRLRPTTLIAAVIPVDHRARFWRVVAKHFDGPQLPGLRLPTPGRIFLAVLMLAATAIGALVEVSTRAFGLSLLTSIAVCVWFWLMASPWRTVPPKSLTTIHDLVRLQAGLTVALQPPNPPVDPTEQLRKIVSNQLGVDPKLVVPEARFIEDLGMG